MPIIKKTSQAGFSLIELLVVATLIIVLTTIGLVSYNKSLLNSRNAKRKTDLETIRQALVMYKLDNGRYPNLTNTQIVGGGNNLGIATYLQTEPGDPKHDGVTYYYQYTGTGTCSAGPPAGCTGFALTARLEPNGATVHTVLNP